MEKYINSMNNKIPMEVTVIGYGKTDHYKGKVFIVNTDPITLIKNDHGSLISEVDIVGTRVEFIPDFISEEDNLVIGSFKEAEKVTGKNIANYNEVVVDKAVVTDMFEWGCYLTVNESVPAILFNTDYFKASKRSHSGSYVGGRLMSIFAIGDEIKGLKGFYSGRLPRLQLLPDKKVNISDVEYYPLENEKDITKGIIVESTVRDVTPTACFVRVSPGHDALCPVPESLNLDFDIMPEDIVSVKLNYNGRGVRGVIVGLVKRSGFKFSDMGKEMDGDF